MDLKDKNRFGIGRLFRSFIFAWTGFKYVIRYEQNMRIHLGISVLIILLAFLFKIPLYQWLILLVVIGIVLALEVMNTAIERTIDFITDEFHPLAKVAKDIAAAAVLTFSFIAVIIGLIIFIPPLMDLIL